MQKMQVPLRSKEEKKLMTNKAKADLKKKKGEE